RRLGATEGSAGRGFRVKLGTHEVYTRGMPSDPKRSAGIVVVRETEDGARFLLLRAYRNWDCPKGLVEPGEDPLDAALRETAEETGIDDLEFPWGYGYHETPVYTG